MATSSSSSPSDLSSYEEQKKKSILDFCQEDPRSNAEGYDLLYSFKADIWEGGKKDFATQLYEKEEKANGDEPVPIINRDLFKVLWIVELIRRRKNPRVTFPSPTLLKNPTDAIPSIVSNITPVGSFPVDQWTKGPAIEKSGYDDYPPDFFFVIQEPYKVVDFDITAADGSVMKLTLVVTAGSADANTGFWGGVFIRDSSKMVATVYSYDDSLTRVEEVASNVGSFVPFADSELDFNSSYLENGRRRFQEYDDEEDIFDQSLSPGSCETQFEKIIGMVMDRIMIPPVGLQSQRPKRPQSAYVRFFKEMRRIIIAENPEIILGGAAKLIESRFKNLGAEERKKYEDIAKEDLKRYKRELEEYNSSKATPNNFFERY